jgi:hypothetical protein
LIPFGSALLALPPEGSVDDSHHINCIWKRPQQEQGFDGVNNSSKVSCPRNQLDLLRMG